MSETATAITTLTADVAAAYFANNPVQPGQINEVIRSIQTGLQSTVVQVEPVKEGVEKLTPSQIKKSITPEALISLEDGRPYKTLKRHLGILGMSPEQYREKWGLPADYPMVCKNYSEQRAALARAAGLGNKKNAKDDPSGVM